MGFLLRFVNRSCAIFPKICLSEVQRCHFTTSSKLFESKNALVALDPIELATGMYRSDILKKLSVDDDPFSVKMLPRGVGTKEYPNMIPSAFESRMVGCICEEDADSIVWMWLQKGESKRCQCGHWFQLYYQAPVKMDNSITL